MTPAGTPPQSETKPGVDAPLPLRRRREVPAWGNGLLAGVCLYFFLSAINVMGAGLKTVGDHTSFLRDLLAHGNSNPLIALFGSVLITAIVQSSSFTTSLIITLVAVGQLEIETAVYAVMGANIGTSVTAVIVAMGNIRIKRQFRRAFAAALVHDVFNWLTVAILFPLEWISSAFHPEGRGLLAQLGRFVADQLGLSPTETGASPIKLITSPVVNTVRAFGSFLSGTPQVSGTIVAIVGLLMLFLALIGMVTNLKGALLRHIEGLFRRVFFRNDGTAYAVGAISTVMVQSSSITTPLIVPLAGAGAVKINRVFPFMLGANLGTTITGVIAATANPVAAAVAVAACHVLFNLIGTVIWYPLKGIPIGISKWYANIAANSKAYAIGFLFGVFLVIPALAIFVVEVILYLIGRGGNV